MSSATHFSYCCDQLCEARAQLSRGGNAQHRQVAEKISGLFGHAARSWSAFDKRQSLLKDQVARGREATYMLGADGQADILAQDNVSQDLKDGLIYVIHSIPKDKVIAGEAAVKNLEKMMERTEGLPEARHTLKRLRKVASNVIRRPCRKPQHEDVWYEGDSSNEDVQLLDAINDAIEALTRVKALDSAAAFFDDVDDLLTCSQRAAGMAEELGVGVVMRNNYKKKLDLSRIGEGQEAVPAAYSAEPVKETAQKSVTVIASADFPPLDAQVDAFARLTIVKLKKSFAEAATVQQAA